MKTFFAFLFALACFFLFSADADACGGRRFGNGRFLDRLRHRDGPIMQRLHNWSKPLERKKDAKPGCPDCKPGKDETAWPEFQGEPEEIPAPKRVAL